MKHTMSKLLTAGALAMIAFAQANAAAAETHNVSQKDKQFSQSELVVKVGDKVVFKNDDVTAHNVFSTTAGNKFNLKVQKPGTASEQVFSNVGEVDVRCAIHPKMTLKIKVIQ